MRRKGQALLESIVAISVLVVGLLATISLLNRSLGISRVVSDNLTATYLAAEGVEIVKNIIDTNGLADRTWYDFGPCTSDTFGVTRACAAQWKDTELRFFDPAQSLYLNTSPVDENLKIYSYENLSGSETTPFRRRIEVTLVNSVELKVNSKVFWTTRGGGSYMVDLEDHFFNWR